MIENFLRPPGSPSEVGADILRGFGALSVLFAAVFFDLRDAAIIAFVLPGLFFPRFIGMRAWADMVFTSTLLIAAWSNVFGLYTRITWWDLPVHFVCTGVVAAGVYLLLAHLRMVTTPGSVEMTTSAGIIFTTTFGLALSALWEMVEWFGRAYVSDEIYAAYGDTIGDMAVGGLGSLGAGFAIAFLPLLRMVTPTQSNISRASTP